MGVDLCSLEHQEPRHLDRREGATLVSEDRVMADAATGGIAGNAMTLGAYAQGSFGKLSLADCALSLQATIGAVSQGDMAVAEATLTSQALALDAIFGELARRASLNLGAHLPTTETYLRLALRAQNQSRATFEALAAIKNPPVVFARQANIAHGAQQINNSAPPRASETQSAPNELSGASHEPLEDARASQGAIGAHPRMAALGAVHGSANR